MLSKPKVGVSLGHVITWNEPTSEMQQVLCKEGMVVFRGRILFMENNCKDIISKELLPNETILWNGQPSLEKTFTKFDIFLVPFSILWGGFAIIWFVIATVVGGIFGLFGIPFVVIGIYIMFGRFLVKKENKKRTYYAITNARLLVIKTDHKGNKKSLHSAQIHSITGEVVSYDKKGIGTIVFGTTPYWFRMYQNTGMDFFTGFSQSNAVSFFDIANCESVLKIYTDLKYQLCSR